MTQTQPAPIKLKIDHVTIAGDLLARMDAAFDAVGLPVDYGGPHSNGVTHMSLLGFDDGSYIELISTLKPGRQETAFWGNHIAGNGGPCAWAVSTTNIAAEARRLRALGVTVRGPDAYHRNRPDGRRVEWELAFLGDKSAGSTLPFLIKDTTPHALRVEPTAGMAGEPGQPALLSGVDSVVLGVQDLAAATALFRRVYHWPAPKITIEPQFGARLAAFAGTPVVLATAVPDPSWLAQRLAEFDDSPCAYLLGATDFNRACRHFNLTPAAGWFGRPVAWFDAIQLGGLWLGIVGQKSG